MKSKVEVLTTPTADTPGTCLLLDFPDKKYLIGHAHEGCQRAMVQRGKKLIKITDLFLTGRVTWKNIGGLLGIVITAADSKSAAFKSVQENAEESRKRRIRQLEKDLEGVNKDSKKWEKTQLRMKAEKERQAKQRADEAAARHNGEFKQSLGICGGRNLMYAIACGRRFIFRKGMPLDVREIEDGAYPPTWIPTWSDSNIEVFGMPILPRNHSDEPVKPEHDKTLKTVVRDMFDSDWRLDQLFEMDLKQVRMPAKLFVRDGGTGKLVPWGGPDPGKVPVDDLPDVKVLVRKPWPAAMVADLPPTSPAEAAVSYIIKNRPQRGKFLAQEAKDLGVPVTKFKLLTEGQTVTLDDGTIVSPDQVLGPGKPGGSFAVVDLPSAEYISNMAERPEWKAHQLMTGLHGIFWLLGPGVETHHLFREFVNSMPTVKHIISAKRLTPNYLAFETAASAQLHLAAIDQAHHPVLEFNDRAASALPQELQHCEIAHPGHVLQLEPTGSWETATEVPRLNSAAVLRAFPPNIRQLSDLTNQNIQSDAKRLQAESENLLGADAEVITLGTGSALPSKHRNVSGTLLRVPGRGSYLFDAGEGTLGQLARMFKHEELLEILRDLRMIWISHMHADHHLGTLSIIKAWYHAVHPDRKRNPRGFFPPSSATFNEDPSRFLSEKRLAVVSDRAMITFIREYFAMENVAQGQVVGISVVPAEVGKPDSTQMSWGDLDVGFSSDNGKVRKAIREMTGLEDLQAAAVEHCKGARAVTISFPDGFKVSYSGDCRPSKRFVEIGKGSTLLIHEATFDDDMIGDAKAKKHSTASEAIKVGIEMGAPRILLTHFSQRYSKIASLDAVARRTFDFEDADPNDADDDGIAGDMPDEDAAGNKDVAAAGPTTTNASSGSSSNTSKPSNVLKNIKVGSAFDYMRVKVKDIAKLERYTPVISALFDSTAEDEEETSKSDDSAKKRKREGP